jgi:hypothetical protein
MSVLLENLEVADAQVIDLHLAEMELADVGPPDGQLPMATAPSASRLTAPPIRAAKPISTSGLLPIMALRSGIIRFESPQLSQ